MGRNARTGRLYLEGFEPRKGGHCESSAMLNALAYLGYGVDEADIAGGGGAPGFMFTNRGFPFVGGRNERMRENFLEAAGIRFGVEVPAAGDAGWEGVFNLLGRGLPVLLRVDMRYLPYLYGGRYGPAYMSFGWHVVCLHGVDFDSGEASVTDTARGGPCLVALRDLDRARGSRTRAFPPRREYAWIEPRPEGWALDPDALARASLAAVLGNYDAPASWGSERGGREGAGRPLAGLAGLAAFPEVLGSLRESVRPQALGAAYAYMADSIERNGTGGSAFRAFFHDFLAARAADCPDPRIRAACAGLLPLAAAAAEAWSALAAEFAAASAALAAAKGGASRDLAAETAARATAGRAAALHEAELALRDAVAAATGR